MSRILPGQFASLTIGIMEQWNDGLRLVEPTPRREYWVHWYSIWLKNTTDLGICPPLKEPESKGWSYRFYLDSGYAIDANHPENRFDRSTGSEGGFYKGSDNRLASQPAPFDTRPDVILRHMRPFFCNC